MNQHFYRPDGLRCPLTCDPLVVWTAHSHSGSQSLRHLPWQLNSIMHPPHCGQTRLIIEEIIFALSSPGIVSIVLMVALRFSHTASCQRNCSLQCCKAICADRVRRYLARGARRFLALRAGLLRSLPSHLYWLRLRSVPDLASAMPNAGTSNRNETDCF